MNEQHVTTPDYQAAQMRDTAPTKNGYLAEAVAEIAQDVDQQKLFKMTASEIEAYLSMVEVTDTGFDISPNFQSPGWGENNDASPDINKSDIGVNPDVIKHELRHALHFFSCVRLFKDEALSEAAFQNFAKGVMVDAAFIEWIAKRANEYGTKNLQFAAELMSHDYDRDAVEASALLLGAITYQHAYFVDAAICEAIASYEDSGAFLNFNHFLNRNVGLLIPGKQPLEGYKNKGMQASIIEADPLKMALMLPKEAYLQDASYWEAEG